MKEKNKVILQEEVLNNNNLLIFIHVPEDNKVYAKIRFIKNNQIIEHYVARLTMEEYLEGDRIVFNEDKTALAVFKKNNDKEILENFYNIEEHSSESSDFLDCAYNLYFKNKVDENFQLIKK